MPKAILIIVSLISFVRISLAATVFEPTFPGTTPSRPDWLSVYTHLNDRVNITTGVPESANDHPVRRVAVFELDAPTTVADLGRASYFRSRALRVGEGRFAVDWHANIRSGVVNPSLELWGNVGGKANDYKNLLLLLEIQSDGNVRQNGAVLGRVEPGWRHFRITVDTAARTYDYLCDGQLVVSGQPLRSSGSGGEPDWNRIGIGYILYVVPGTLPMRWEVGGIKVTKGAADGDGASEAVRVRDQAVSLWSPEFPQGRLVVLEGESATATAVLYELLAANPKPGRSIAIDVVPYALPEGEDRGRRIASRPRSSKVSASSVEVVSPVLARELGLEPGDLPAVVFTAPSGEVRGRWTGPLDATVSGRIVSAMKDPSPHGARAFPHAAVASSAADPQSEPLQGRRHTPARWLTLGTWAAPAGLSLWGLDYEGEVRPNPGEPQIVTYWDASWHARWEERITATDGGVIIEKLARDFTWPKGSAYAHLYLYSPGEAEVSLELTQTGAELRGWLNGHSLDWRRDTGRREIEVEQAGVNDQGGTVVVRRTEGGSAHTALLRLDAGWNRLLVKLVMRHRQGETFAFASSFSASDESVLSGLRTSLANPEPSRISRAVASRFVPRVYTSALFNLVHSGEPLVFDVDIGGADLLEGTVAPFPAQSPGRLELTVTDYDGAEIVRRTLPFALPGRTVFDLGVAPARGYYATHLRLFDEDDNLVHVYPSDGFSVIGGTAAQRERKDDKKMSVNYYFMAGGERYLNLFFPYMERLGILHNLGGNHQRAPDFYRQAHERGLEVIADTWLHRDPDYVRAYVEESAPYVRTFKALNEVDIHPQQRGTPESWVAKAKMDYEIVKAVKPDALMIGASLVRPANDEWFEECLKLGLANYHDVWDVHCYPQRPPVLEGTMSNSPRETELGVLNVYAKLGMTNDKPFWIGETAARSGHGFDGRRWQADTTAKIVACVLSREDFQRVGFLVPWRYSRGESRYYIMDIEAGHMPAEAAYYTASALIDGFGYTRLALGDDVQAARFGPTVMAWVTGNQTRSISVKPEGKAPFVLVDVVGRVSELPHKAGSVTIEVNGSPVYVLSRDTYERLTRFE